MVVISKQSKHNTPKNSKNKVLGAVVKLTIVGGTLTALGAISVVTPIFANLGTNLLSLYSALSLDKVQTEPTSIIVLGGGLTQNDSKEILLNHYSQSRADATINQYQKTPKTIITSGAESPWLMDYLSSQLGNQAVIISDNASMNTCENAIFTAKLLAHHELPTTAYLVTDRYHMARARRQFALAGIQTIPIAAPLAVAPSWRHFKDNLVHSRRTVYEILALGRDIFAPQSNCRSTDEITLEEISTPRRKPKIFL